MQIPVLFGMLTTFLSTDGVVNADFLAQKYEISKRTVYRYVETLSESGVPLESHLGRGGGWSVVSAYKLGATYLTKEEYAILFNLLDACEDKQVQGISDKLKCLLRG